ncbi:MULTISPECIES: SDR family NAD(P)-dependent oxidoreductase [unclassified Streptomyces]|uniref:SDR family NAD(P)-dependent oxidoreductase n=1 Tax=Streptomyces sp. AM 3-1-1 TaxID=3028711 RepID=UPI0023BA1796|nr:SDR family NAD(P)-dependent oxidoreductase [Streptomyces sp. AM 3-1-1]WEH26268.1 SDR family NAD(P)-dependent oxidoreductase [Streptomyces sp. AM 3-1-1]
MDHGTGQDAESVTGGGELLVVLGVGPGLGMSMAERFGAEGHDLALVSRSAARHPSYRARLAERGIGSRTYAADVNDPEDLHRVLAEIRAAQGPVGAAWFGPASTESPAIVPLPDAGPEALLAPVRALLAPLPHVVRELVPDMVARGRGTLFFGVGGSGLVPTPALGTLAPASAAARMYVLTLAETLGEKGVHVAALTIGGVIARGDIHRSLAAQPGLLDAFGTLDPDDIAAAAWELHRERDRHELVFGGA